MNRVEIVAEAADLETVHRGLGHSGLTMGGRRVVTLRFPGIVIQIQGTDDELDELRTRIAVGMTP